MNIIEIGLSTKWLRHADKNFSHVWQNNERRTRANRPGRIFFFRFFFFRVHSFPECFTLFGTAVQFNHFRFDTRHLVSVFLSVESNFSIFPFLFSFAVPSRRGKLLLLTSFLFIFSPSVGDKRMKKEKLKLRLCAGRWRERTKRSARWAPTECRKTCAKLSALAFDLHKQIVVFSRLPRCASRVRLLFFSCSPRQPHFHRSSSLFLFFRFHFFVIQFWNSTAVKQLSAACTTKRKCLRRAS